MPRKTIHSPGGTPEPIRYLPVINDATSAAPPGAAMRIVSIDEDGFAHISQPNKFGQVDDIIFNALLTLPAGSEGTGTKDLPAIAAYSVVGGGAGGTGIPDEGEVWGTTPNSWFLSENACGNGFKVLGGAGDGLVNVERADNKPFFARILSRTSSSCGNSGSGSGDTDHTLYTYTVHSVRFVDDGDGCPTAINDEIDVAITGTAYEVNNNAVAVGTIVEVESVTYTDEQVSGSGTNTTGPAGCRLVFTSQSSASAANIPCQSRYRYFCVGGISKEYREDCDGTLTFLRNNGCCDCNDGSGSGNDTCTVCPSPPATLCLALPSVPPELDSIGCDYPREITLSFAETSGLNQRWTGTEVGGQNVTWRATLVVTCGTIYDVHIDVDGGVGTTCQFGGTLVDGTHCTFPQTIALETIYLFQNISVGNAVISVGACAGDPDTTSGSGGAGDCPCQWQWTGTPALGAWGLIYQSGECVCGTMPGTNGTYDGEIRNTECDGTACDGGAGGGSGPTSCGTIQAAVTVSNQTGFLASMANTTLPYIGEQSAGVPVYAEAIPGQTYCSQQSRLVIWREAGRWYCYLNGTSSTATEAEPGATCANMVFNLNYTTANGLCPAQSGSATITAVIT